MINRGQFRREKDEPSLRAELKRLRLASGLTQRAAAEKLGSSITTLARIEQGAFLLNEQRLAALLKVYCVEDEAHVWELWRQDRRRRDEERRNAPPRLTDTSAEAYLVAAIDRLGDTNEMLRYLVHAVQGQPIVNQRDVTSVDCCFISYSRDDEEFATKLNNELSKYGLSVWYSPGGVRAGEKMAEQIYDGIESHERLLLVLSESSMTSNWVRLEIYRARKLERQDGQQRFFPIRLVPFASLRDWELIDDNTGEDLAREVRSYFIPDFEEWREPAKFEAAMAKLLRDLQP